jgi:hypothetical protein
MNWCFHCEPLRAEWLSRAADTMTYDVRPTAAVTPKFCPWTMCSRASNRPTIESNDNLDKKRYPKWKQPDEWYWRKRMGARGTKKYHLVQLHGRI